MSDRRTASWSLASWSIASVCGVAVAAVLVGFVWLPSAQSDFGAQGLWASICRAAGVPTTWSGPQGAAGPGGHSTSVVLGAVVAEQKAKVGADIAVGRGATLALQCTVCHGARGLSEANAPNLAGQYAEVIVKQLTDYQRGDRSSAIMQALAANLSAPEVRDLAAYYAELPKPKSAAAHGEDVPPALIRVGSPMRNIAPCASCHAGVGGKLGAPWLEGMPKDYLLAQLKGFASGARRNDSHGQMRNMARTLTVDEIEALASFYARADPSEGRH